MISLKQSLNDYERSQCLASGVAETLLTTLDSLRQYVVETEPSVVAQFRVWADGLIGNVKEYINEPNEQSFGEVRTSIRAGLRDYRDRAGRYINELRESLATTTTALHEMVATLQSADSDAEAELKNEITHLESMERLTAVEEIRAGLRKSVVSLAGCITQLRQEKDIVVSQLRDEIRTLQNSLEEARRAAITDAATGVHNRQEFEKRVTQEISSGRSASVVRLTLQNFGNLTSWYPRSTMDQLLSAFCKRARGVLPEDTMLGRWRDNVFCALVHAADVRAVVASLVRKCGGNYICMDREHARTLYVQVAVMSFTCESGSDAEIVIQMLDNSGTK